MNAVHFSSASTEWSTPQDFFDQLNAEFGFTLDVCASKENAKCEFFYSPANDGLEQFWAQDAKKLGGAIWMNPPYGRGIGVWVSKASAAAQNGATVVCLLPARTDTRWWHDYIQDKAEVRFVRGRLKFGGAKNSAPFPSVVVIFRGQP